MMGNILDKLEKYATNLEDIVNQRTSELVEEKKKTDLLLYSMMPRLFLNTIVCLFKSLINAENIQLRS